MCFREILTFFSKGISYTRRIFIHFVVATATASAGKCIISIIINYLKKIMGVGMQGGSGSVTYDGIGIHCSEFRTYVIYIYQLLKIQQ